MSISIKQQQAYRSTILIGSALIVVSMIFGCKTNSENDTAFAKADTETNINTQPVVQRSISQEWKDYWYAGTAEITSYELQQARYGELREGTAALIFVTEDFLPEKQVKADNQDSNNIPVLKLNATKNFVTGIYPYSIMSSTFLPVNEELHAVKVSQSMQEWCGNTYAQLNNRDQFEVQIHSYFESRADEEFTLEKAILENELWALLRIDPTLLPTGSFTSIPDVSYAAMTHTTIKAYEVTGSLTATSYTLNYPSLDRTLTINFASDFPHQIEGWEETYPDGRGGEKMTTTATKMKTIRSAYWGKKTKEDEALRTELGL